MKISVESLMRISSTYSSMSLKRSGTLQRIDMSNEYELPEESILPLSIQLVTYFPWKFASLREVGDAIVEKRHVQTDQFKPSEIPGIKTFADLYGDSNSYTEGYIRNLFQKKSLLNAQLEADENALYVLITPLLIFAMTKGRQVQYYECFDADVTTKTITTIINKDMEDEMNAVCEFFGYEHVNTELVDESILSTEDRSTELIMVEYELKYFKTSEIS